MLILFFSVLACKLLLLTKIILKSQNISLPASFSLTSILLQENYRFQPFSSFAYTRSIPFPVICLPYPSTRDSCAQTPATSPFSVPTELRVSEELSCENWRSVKSISPTEIWDNYRLPPFLQAFENLWRIIKWELINSMSLQCFLSLSNSLHKSLVLLILLSHYKQLNLRLKITTKKMKGSQVTNILTPNRKFRL